MTEANAIQILIAFARPIRSDKIEEYESNYKIIDEFKKICKKKHILQNKTIVSMMKIFVEENRGVLDDEIKKD